MGAKKCEICLQEYVTHIDVGRCGRCVLSEPVWRTRFAAEIASLIDGESDDSFKKAISQAVNLVSGLNKNSNQ